MRERHRIKGVGEGEDKGWRKEGVERNVKKGYHHKVKRENSKKEVITLGSSNSRRSI